MGIFGRISEIFKQYEPTEEETKLFEEKLQKNIETGDLSEYDFLKISISEHNWLPETRNYYEDLYNLFIGSYGIGIDQEGNFSFVMTYKYTNSKNYKKEIIGKFENKLLVSIKKILSENNFLGFKKDELLLYLDAYREKGSSIRLSFENDKEIGFSNRDYSYGRYEEVLKSIKEIIGFDDFFENVLLELKEGKFE